MTWISVTLGVGKVPAGASWAQIYGLALLTGIGFTISLFIGSLAFETSDYQDTVRIGVLSGSLLSALAGYGVPYLVGGRRQGALAASGEL